MSGAILGWSVLIAQIAVGLAMILAATRMMTGPRAQDKVLGLDTVYLSAMLQFLLFGIRTGTSIYFEIALAIAILSFVSTVALAKFLMRGEVIE